MEDLGNRNLLVSEYIIGTELPSIVTSKQISDVEFLYKWIHLKENDFDMKNYRCDRTMNITFLHIIEIEEFKEIVKDIVLIYKKSYQYGVKKDFLEHVFKYTIQFLKKFLSIPNDYFVAYYKPSNIKKNMFYCDKFDERRIIDLVIEPSKDIPWIKQYYAKVLEEILNLDFDKISNQTLSSPTHQFDFKQGTLIKQPKEATNPSTDNNDPTNPAESGYPPKEEIYTEKYLFFLNGKSWKENERYIDEITYKRLIEYSDFYFKKLKLPENLQPIKSHLLKAGELRYAFYLIFKDLYPQLDYPKSLFDFLVKVFPLLKDPKNRKFRQTANYKKFKNKPQYWDKLMKKNQ